MALPSVLSEKGLAKFRTKLCERLLATGTCAFGDKCQYSHSDRPRRNPQKVSYVARRCPDPDTCELGAACGYAHSRDEELYHPSMYKSIMCAGGSGCGGYYCSMAHSVDELRPKERTSSLQTGGERSPQQATSRGITSASSSSEQVAAPAASQAEGGTGGTPCVEVEGGCNVIEHSGTSDPHADVPIPASGRGILESLTEDVESWWYAGDQRDLRVCVKEMVPAQPGDGDALVGGILRPGLFSSKNQAGRQHEFEVRCQVKLMTISRGDSQIAAQVVKEAKRWIAHSGVPGTSLANHGQRAFVLRRTVATTVLALPEWASTLCHSVRRMQNSLAQQAAMQWPLITALATWAKQLVSQLQALHSEGIAHLCVGPQTITVDASGALHIGDFMGKIRALRFFESCGRGKLDEPWAMWYPAEVHRCGSADESCGSHNIDIFRVDSWQLGVCIFYMLTGEHPFGDRRSPAAVCDNIVADRRVNRPMLEHLPLFADLVGRLTERCPDQRLLPSEVGNHPVFWASTDAVRFALPFLQLKQPAIWQNGGSALWAWLRHIPSLALFCTALPASDTGGKGHQDFLASVCDKALRTMSVPVFDLDSLRSHALACSRAPPVSATATKRVAVSAPVAAAARVPATPEAAPRKSVPESPPLLMTLPLLPRHEVGQAQELTPSGPAKNWLGSHGPTAEVLAAPPGLEEFAATACSPTSSLLHRSDVPMLGTQPRIPQYPSTTFGVPQTSVAHAPGVAPTSSFVGWPHGHHLPPLASSRPMHMDASEGSRRGVTGLGVGSLGLVQATGHDEEIGHLMPHVGVQPRMWEHAVPLYGSEAVLAHYQTGLPYLELPGYLQNLTLAQRAALEQTTAWAKAQHHALLQAYVQNQSGAPAPYAGFVTSPPNFMQMPDTLLTPSTPPMARTPNYAGYCGTGFDPMATMACTPERDPRTAAAFVDPFYSPVKPPRPQAPLAAVDVLTLLESGVLRCSASEADYPEIAEGRGQTAAGILGTQPTAEGATPEPTFGTIEAKLERLMASLDDDDADHASREQAAPGGSQIDTAGELGCLPVDLLSAMEGSSGRIHRSV